MKNTVTSEKKDFSWHDELKADEIPDSPVTGYLNGNEVSFQYINFEKWRGSNDNVIIFSLVKPAQNCGFIEGFEGFVLTNKLKWGWMKFYFLSNL